MLVEELKKSFSLVWMAFGGNKAPEHTFHGFLINISATVFMSIDELVCYVGRSPWEGFHRQCASRAQCELVAT